MAERVNSFADLDDLPKLAPDPHHHKPVDPAMIEQMSETHGFPSRSPKRVEAPQEEPAAPASLQVLINDAEKTKLSAFNLPESFRTMLKDIASATGSDMTKVLIAAATPQLEMWQAEVKRRKKR